MAVVAVLILVSMLSACGQKGSLYLPTEAAARNRATLPQVLLPIGAPPATPANPTPSDTTATATVAPLSPASATR
jgi:predicted small lipoprotein YifL